MDTKILPIRQRDQELIAKASATLVKHGVSDDLAKEVLLGLVSDIHDADAQRDEQDVRIDPSLHGAVMMLLCHVIGDNREAQDTLGHEYRCDASGRVQADIVFTYNGVKVDFVKAIQGLGLGWDRAVERVAMAKVEEHFGKMRDVLTNMHRIAVDAFPDADRD